MGCYETVVYDLIFIKAERCQLNVSRHNIFISEPLCLQEKERIFSRKWGNCVLVRRCYIHIIEFSPLLPGRAFKGCSVEFLPTKGNEVLISAYKNKISCFWSSYGWLAVVRRRSLKENRAYSISGSFLFSETNAALIHQGRGMLGLAGNPRSP